MSIVVATAITTDYLNWDEISKDFMPTNEISRAYLASFILVMDLMIVMQVSLMLSYIRRVLTWENLYRPRGDDTENIIFWKRENSVFFLSL